jgi:hypothetical protein
LLQERREEAAGQRPFDNPQPLDRLPEESQRDATDEQNDAAE